MNNNDNPIPPVPVQEPTPCCCDQEACCQIASAQHKVAWSVHPNQLPNTNWRMFHVEHSPGKPRAYPDVAFEPSFHPKTWGNELWIHDGPDYTFKLLYFMSGTHGSFHYHVRKTETWFVSSGEFTLKLANADTGTIDEIPIGQGDVVHLPPGSAHQLFCHEAGQIFEASTPHSENDTYRISPTFQPPPNPPPPQEAA